MYQQLYDQVYDSNYSSLFDDYVAVISSNAAHQLEPLNAKFQFVKITENWTIDSGSVCSIITQFLTDINFKSTHHHDGLLQDVKKISKDFQSNRSMYLEELQPIVADNNWICEDACLTVVEEGQKLIIGRDLFSSLGLVVVQLQAKKGKCLNNIDNSICKIKQAIALQFPDLVSRIGLSKTQVVKSMFCQS